MATETTTIKVVADTREAERALGRLNSALGALVTGAAITQFARFADSVSNLQTKLNLVTQEGQSAAQMFQIVAQSAIKLGAPLEDVGNLFFRVANNTRDLGLAQTDQIKITETLIKGFQLTGATAGEVAGGVVQLGQAFAIGTLRGDELNSVMESLPMVAQALADKFGVQTGALKMLGEQGKITSKDLADAILSSGQAIDSAWGQKLPTIQGAFNAIANSMKVAFQEADAGAGITSSLAIALVRIATAMVNVIKFFEEWGGILKNVLSILAGLAAFTVLGRVLGAIGGAVSGVIAAFSTFRNGLSSLKLTFEILGKNISKFIDGLIPADKMIGVLGRRFSWLTDGVKKLIGPIVTLGGAIAATLGVDKLFAKKDTNAANEYKTELEKLNDALGIKNVQASEKAREASNALTAEQVKNAGLIDKANKERTNSYQEILRNQQTSVALSKLESNELQVQQALNDINKQLIKDIKNDKGDIIGQTKGLSAEEEKILRLLIEQGIQNGLQREITDQMNSLKAESNRLNIFDLNLREQQAAVDAQRLKYGQLFTSEMERQTREIVAQQQAIRDTMAVEQARRKLLGQQTFAEGVQRGVGTLERLNPGRILARDYQMDIDALKMSLDAKLITEESYQRQLLLLKREYADKANQLYIQQVETEKQQRATAIQAEQMRLGKTAEQAKGYADFEMKTTAEKTQFAIEQAASLYSSLGTYNKQAFEAAKAFNIANAIMNTYMAATKALATYPWPFSMIAAGAAVAMGLAQVAQIRSQNYSGRALGGPVMGGNPYIVGENGPELFVPNTTGSITRNDQLGGGVTNVNFTIQANDAQGFDDLLIQRRGMITQMISDAMVERGQRAL